MKDIVIVGAGGFGRELLLWIKAINKATPKWRIKGFIDDNPKALAGYECDHRVIGRIQDWQPAQDEVFACAIAEPRTKEKIVSLLKSKGAFFEKIIHPAVSLGEFNKLGEGVVMYPRAALTVNIQIGDFVTLLSSGIGHDVVVGDYSTISSNCGINGKVRIGKRVFLASHVVIVPGRTIGDDAYVGAGSVVIRNVREKSKVFGNPAKIVDL